MVKSKLTFNSPAFRCHLSCGQCTHLKVNGARCKNRVCFGTPICWVHTMRLYGVKVRTSPVAGKGLFATRPFQSGSWICPYIGEGVTGACLNQRYPGDRTAPYAVENDGSYVDSACVRGVGAMSNGLFRRNGAPRAASRHNSELVERRRGELWLRATKDITIGSEIFTHYGETYRIENDHSTKRSRKADNRPC